MGAPAGNQNAAKKNREWANAIRRVVAQNDSEKLRAMAEKVVAMAEAGDIQAMREVGDRLDGRPAQQLIHSGDEDAPLVAKIVREVAK